MLCRAMSINAHTPPIRDSICSKTAGFFPADPDHLVAKLGAAQVDTFFQAPCSPQGVLSRVLRSAALDGMDEEAASLTACRGGRSQGG